MNKRNDLQAKLNFCHTTVGLMHFTGRKCSISCFYEWNIVRLYDPKTMFNKSLLLLLILLACHIMNSSGQNLFPDYRFKVLENSDTLSYPFAAGLNSPIFAEIDLDGNSINDLLILEKLTGRILTFINHGNPGQTDYQFAPQYIPAIPTLSEWVRSYDYDCDGDLDLFTYTISYTYNALGEGATRVYRNDYSVGTGMVLTQVTNEILTTYSNILKVIPSSPVNLPAFVDIDNDGDMDILAFSLSSNFLEYHKNYSMDSTGVCGGFLFHVEPNCWGQFTLSGVENKAILNSSCQQIPDNINLHSGSVLTAFDQLCDGDIDLINGDILGANLLFLNNTGSTTAAFISSQDSLFPSNNVPVNFYNLPGAYYFDGDNDGKKDMVVSGFLPGEDFNNVLFYKNATDNCTNQFQFQQNRFLVEDMIDVGTGSTPVFFDADNDGLMDLIIGNDYYYSIITAQKVANLAWYKNTGTLTNPVFTLIDRDFANVSSLGILGAYPAFGDLDADGDKDLLLGNVNGDLIFYRNVGGTPNAFVFVTAMYQNIDVGANSMPQLIDVDRDGLDDLLIGERSGVLNYYRNTGTAVNPVYTLMNSNFGGVNVLLAPSIQGNSVPFLYDNNGNYELLVGSESGYIYYYNNIDGNLSGTFTLVDSSYESIYEPARVSISRFDIDNDTNADLVTGNFAGGVRFYTHYNAAGINTNNENPENLFTLFPNPAGDYIHLLLKKVLTTKSIDVSIIDVMGRNLCSYKLSVSDNMVIPVAELTGGFYFIRMNINGTDFVKTIIKE